MLEEFTSLGKWWLPSNPEVVVPGKLIFSPERGATLELIGSFYDSQFLEINRTEKTALPNDSFSIRKSGVPCKFINPEENIILGFLDNNEDITLFQCFGKIKKIEFVKSKLTLFLYVKYVFRKIHFQSEQNIKLKSISIRYSNLEEWVGRSGISLIYTKEEPLNSIGMLYNPPSNIPLAKRGTLNLEITFSKIYPHPFMFYETYYKANLEQKNYLTIHNLENRPLDECITLYNFIGNTEERTRFARRASETRNALTHHDREKRKKAAKDRELFRLFHTLTTILRICLLRELNLYDDSIKRLVDRNRSYQDEWRPSSTSTDDR